MLVVVQNLIIFELHEISKQKQKQNKKHINDKYGILTHNLW